MIRSLDNPLEAAAEALERPQNFMYMGDLDESDGWGRAFGQSRDSDALEASNWRVITADLLERFPDDFAVERSSHWAVGWVDEGRVRVLVDPSAGIVAENLTDCFRAVLAWNEKLDGYPVADESDWCELEWEMNHPEGDRYCYSEDDDCGCGRETA